MADVCGDVAERVTADALWRIGFSGIIEAFVRILYQSRRNAIRAIPDSKAPHRNPPFVGTTANIDGVFMFRIGAV